MSTAIQALPRLVSDSGLTRYLQEVRKFPMLEVDEEFMLAQRWREHKDPEAAHRLVTSHLRLVAKIAMGYRGYGLPINELIAEGNVGMMQAVKRFDPDRGLSAAATSVRSSTACFEAPGPAPALPWSCAAPRVPVRQLSSTTRRRRRTFQTAS